MPPGMRLPSLYCTGDPDAWEAEKEKEIDTIRYKLIAYFFIWSYPCLAFKKFCLSL
jgi:hypothetical protein